MVSAEIQSGYQIGVPIRQVQTPCQVTIVRVRNAHSEGQLGVPVCTYWRGRLLMTGRLGVFLLAEGSVPILVPREAGGLQ